MFNTLCFGQFWSLFIVTYNAQFISQNSSLFLPGIQINIYSHFNGMTTQALSAWALPSIPVRIFPEKRKSVPRNCWKIYRECLMLQATNLPKKGGRSECSKLGLISEPLAFFTVPHPLYLQDLMRAPRSLWQNIFCLRSLDPLRTLLPLFFPLCLWHWISLWELFF